MKPLHIRAAVAGGLIVAAGALAGYVSSPSPGLSGAAAIVVVVAIPVAALTLLGTRTNRRIRGSGLEGIGRGPLWGQETSEPRRR